MNNANTMKENSLERIEIELGQAISNSGGIIQEMCSHIRCAGGKRVRPQLLIACGSIFGEAEKELVSAAVAAELIHMASLVHDDIIDDSDLRRSRPAINKVWGTHHAVLCGDYLFASAFGILSQNGLKAGMLYMVDAIENMCQGEILQAENRHNFDIDTDIYFEIILKKTAIFIKNCCMAGAVIGGGNEQQVSLLGDFGLHLGMAFQIIDDLLDFCGNKEITGKPGLEDLKQGCLTLPIILLLKKSGYRKWLTDIYSKNLFTQELQQEIYQTLQMSGDLEHTFHTADYHINKAKAALSVLPDSEHIRFLYSLTDALKDRIY